MEDDAPVGAEGTDTIDPNESVEFDSIVDDVEDASTDEAVAEGSDQGAEDDSPIYTVKVDGQEIEVSLDELVNGYSRQADYTRKTQELAAEKQRLSTLAGFQDALDRDPAAAIQALAQVMGVQLGTQQSQVEDLSELDPLEREVRELRQQLSQVTQNQASQQELARRAQITAEAQSAIAAHKLQVAPEALVQFAYENGIGNLAIAADYMARKGVAEARKAEVVKVTERKRAARVVSGGANRTANATTAPPVNSIDDAFRQAFAEHTR